MVCIGTDRPQPWSVVAIAIMSLTGGALRGEAFAAGWCSNRDQLSPLWRGPGAVRRWL